MEPRIRLSGSMSEGYLFKKFSNLLNSQCPVNIMEDSALVNVPLKSQNRVVTCHLFDAR